MITIREINGRSWWILCECTRYDTYEACLAAYNDLKAAIAAGELECI